MSNYIINKDKYYVETKTDKKIPIDDLHKEVLSIMDEIDKICRKNDIRYALMAGSALGAYNYGGFIPWDDDIDVCVPIEDWDRFIDAMKKELPKGFYFDSYEIDKRFNTINGPWMKVRKRGTYIEEVNVLLKNRCKRGNGIFVDVIPYGGVAKNKFIDELERTIVKINMLFIVLLDNLHINPIPFKAFVYWFSKKCMKWHKNSPLVSQPVSVPWEKFLHEPVFKKEDVYPIKEYDFEGRKFYSYNNIEKILVEWYGPRCLKQWNGKKWINPYPVEKRKPKHAKDLNLNGEGSIGEK
jgi:lipopolysaccharide cholinephosphotransferase